MSPRKKSASPKTKYRKDSLLLRPQKGVGIKLCFSGITGSFTADRFLSHQPHYVLCVLFYHYIKESFGLPVNFQIVLILLYFYKHLQMFKCLVVYLPKFSFDRQDETNMGELVRLQKSILCCIFISVVLVLFLLYVVNKIYK